MKKSFWKIFKEEVFTEPVYIKCNNANCKNNKYNNCAKCYPDEVMITSEGKCNSFEIINDTYEVKKGEIIDITKEYKCLNCSNTLEFKWENIRSQRKIATCCHKQYSIIPSNLYKVESIEDDPYYLYKLSPKYKLDEMFKDELEYSLRIVDIVESSKPYKIVALYPDSTEIYYVDEEYLDNCRKRESKK